MSANSMPSSLASIPRRLRYVQNFSFVLFSVDIRQAMDPQQRLQLECAYEAMESGMLFQVFAPSMSLMGDAEE